VRNNRPLQATPLDQLSLCSNFFVRNEVPKSKPSSIHVVKIGEGLANGNSLGSEPNGDAQADISVCSWVGLDLISQVGFAAHGPHKASR
jgi:hypothetical protein